MTDLSARERAIVDTVRANDLAGRIEVRKSMRIGRCQVVYQWRSRENAWGRFGGGWNWSLGIQAGGSTVIVNCLVFNLRFTWGQS